jgi:hypothetical protein
MTTGLGLPVQVINNLVEYGFNGALYLATVQQRGADTASAFSFYSAVISALNSIEAGASAVPVFGAPATSDYSYGLATLPPLVAVGHITDWAYGLTTVPPLVAVGAISDAAHGIANINLVATGVMAG